MPKNKKCFRFTLLTDASVSIFR